MIGSAVFSYLPQLSVGIALSFEEEAVWNVLQRPLRGALFEHLTRIVQLMRKKRTLMLMPEDEEYTTQAAADHLGVSRRHLVDLLKDGDIPFHKVGKFRDLAVYEKRWDNGRREVLRALAGEVDEAGLY